MPKTSQRQPQVQAAVLHDPGGAFVAIHTADGNVILSPALAQQVALRILEVTAITVTTADRIAQIPGRPDPVL